MEEKKLLPVHEVITVANGNSEKLGLRCVPNKIPDVIVMMLRFGSATVFQEQVTCIKCLEAKKKSRTLH